MKSGMVVSGLIVIKTVSHLLFTNFFLNLEIWSPSICRLNYEQVSRIILWSRIGRDRCVILQFLTRSTQTNRRTDRRTNQRSDKAAYRVRYWKCTLHPKFLTHQQRHLIFHTFLLFGLTDSKAVFWIFDCIITKMNQIYLITIIISIFLIYTI